MTLYYSTKWIFLTIYFCSAVSATALNRQGKAYLDIFNVIRLNPTSRLAIGVQITFPISVFMPDLGLFGRQSRSWYSLTQRYLWQTKPSMTAQFPTCPSQRLSLEDYLNLLHIEVEPCQERFICEIASDPAKFQPLSKILLDKLAFTAQWVNRTSYNYNLHYLVEAARIGVDPNRDCEATYKNCPVPATSMINMSLLWLWQMLSQIIDIKFIGELETELYND